MDFCGCSGMFFPQFLWNCNEQIPVSSLLLVYTFFCHFYLYLDFVLTGSGVNSKLDHLDIVLIKMLIDVFNLLTAYLIIFIIYFYLFKKKIPFLWQKGDEGEEGVTSEGIHILLSWSEQRHCKCSFSVLLKSVWPIRWLGNRHKIDKTKLVNVKQVMVKH